MPDLNHAAFTVVYLGAVELEKEVLHCVPGVLCLQCWRLKPERALLFAMRELGNPLSDVLRRQRFLRYKRGCINESCRTCQRDGTLLQRIWNVKSAPIGI